MSLHGHYDDSHVTILVQARRPVSVAAGATEFRRKRKHPNPIPQQTRSRATDDADDTLESRIFFLGAFYHVGDILADGTTC